MCQQSLVDRGLLKYTNPSPGSSPFVHLDVSRYPFILMWYVFFSLPQIKKEKKKHQPTAWRVKWQMKPLTDPDMNDMYIPKVIPSYLYTMSIHYTYICDDQRSTIRNKVFLCVSFWITCVSLNWFNSPNSPQAITGLELIDLIHKCISCRGQFFVWLLFPSCNINYPDSLDLQSHCAWYFNGL